MIFADIFLCQCVLYCYFICHHIWIQTVNIQIAKQWLCYTGQVFNDRAFSRHTQYSNISMQLGYHHLIYTTVSYIFLILIWMIYSFIELVIYCFKDFKLEVFTTTSTGSRSVLALNLKNVRTFFFDEFKNLTWHCIAPMLLLSLIIKPGLSLLVQY